MACTIGRVELGTAMGSKWVRHPVPIGKGLGHFKWDIVGGSLMMWREEKFSGYYNGYK